MPDPIDMSYISTLWFGYEVKVARLKLRKAFRYNVLGKENALNLALAYRDQLYKDHSLQPLRQKGSPLIRVKNRTNPQLISGINLSIEGSHNGGFYAYFRCHWFEDGQWKRARFSIKKLGYETAFRKALEKRLMTGDLGIDAELFPTPLPSLDEFIKLLTIDKNIPNPKLINKNS